MSLVKTDASGNLFLSSDSGICKIPLTFWVSSFSISIIISLSEKGFELSEQTDEDIRKLVQYRAREEGLKMKLEDIACDTFGAPVL